MNRPWIDPVVEEARAAGEELARETGYDISKFFERLREMDRADTSRRYVREGARVEATQSGPPRR